VIDVLDEPPAFLQLASQPVRWAILRRLVHGDYLVAELTREIGEPQNLVSYHVKQLRAAGLVNARRSARDGRESYYRIDFARCRELLMATADQLHPGLSPGHAGVPRPMRVLFLCTGNSARSQMAEGMLRARSAGLIAASSAGDRPRPVHPLAIAAMAARGIDISAQRSKHLDEFAQESFDAVITLCDLVRERCPSFETGVRRLHWSIEDPAVEGSARRAFESVADNLDERIGRFIAWARTGTAA
jgi:protein-tyrosine-phosphatase/DNA-binding transcriptional ArsR family regulator